ncbi:class I adenylate-forming enzyme family protein [Arthrobacter sp. MMS18-M83]|uniref:class I adenylate-forming enzyme family protein n=1 Tax=Arthrobacter sp. MMS18-M83 TaxID=2996261 RepID=UPI00227CDBD4|nr:AMP-binding protein [Arthrobacter sp. MMS18-M83]WAH97652.1 AMP-binding protein [Arthrobacter sp. MMS18-M83]
MLVGDIPRLNARRYAGKTAVICGDRELTWSAVNERANRLGAYLLGAGLQRGDRVAVIASNILEWPEISFGISKAGLVLVPVNVRLAVPEIIFLLDDAGAKALIFDSESANVASEVIAAGNGLGVVLQIGGSDLAPEYEREIDAVGSATLSSAGLSPDDLRALIYTSGTTGLPKAVTNTHRAMIYGAMDHVQTVNAKSTDVGLAITPFFTSGGAMRTLSWAYLGQTMVVLPKFNEEQIVHHFKRYNVTNTIMVPTMLSRLCTYLQTQPHQDFPALGSIGYGSAPSSPALIRNAMDLLGCDFWQRYGQSEVAGFVTHLSPQDHREIVAGRAEIAKSCGTESASSDITVLDDDGQELPPGEIGEVVIKSDAVSNGYWNRPDVTAERFWRGELHTGDMAYRDQDGYLYLVDRKNDLIISGAFNIYPGEIERIINTHPAVRMAAVFGVPHPAWGETPIVAVVPSDDWVAGTPALEQELKDLCRANLAGYKQPGGFEFLDEFPVSAAGKILKTELKKPHQKQGS